MTKCIICKKSISGLSFCSESCFLIRKRQFEGKIGQDQIAKEILCKKGDVE